MNDIRISKTISLDQKLKGKGPYTSIFREVITYALKVGASDIHIEPTTEGVLIFIRVDGERSLYKRLDLVHQQNFINEVKKLSSLSIALKGKVQDARASYKELGLDLRANVFPIEADDRIVLRLCDNKKIIRLEELGHSSKTFKSLKSLVNLRNGLVLISGPTGSGKTNTLYGILDSIDRIKNSVLTIENPIEKNIKYVSQGEIKEGKFSFADALKASFRQDPDVIMVGEIRDRETAETALEAAGTGHLVFSTIHANNAMDVIQRLIDLKISPSKIQSYLRFSGAQRLVRSLCPSCKDPLVYNSKKLDEFLLWADHHKLAFSDKARFMLRNSKGCKLCSKVGVPGTMGRIPLMEYLEGDILSNYLKSKTLPNDNFTSLRKLALKRAEEGIICVDTVMGVE